MKASWRTSTFGVMALVTALGLLASAFSAQFDGDPATTPLWEQAFEALAVALTGLGLVFARDDKVTSEKAGAK